MNLLQTEENFSSPDIPPAPYDTMSSLEFDNRFVRELPGDPDPVNRRRQVLGACYSRVSPTPVKAPRLAAFSPEGAALLDLPPQVSQDPEFAATLGGNRLLEGMAPFAMNYGGHQFGHWAGQLGDGRAINLGEVVNSISQRWVVQLKGAGPTPYSRNADGLAVLRSSVREFLVSEAMFHLGVPTTRALSLVLTGEEVERDMFYDGHPKLEPGAVVCRLSPSFIRFGNFQILAMREETDLLQKLVNYTIHTDFPHLGSPSPEVYLQWFDEVCRTTAELMVHWMRVGFVHGVMNTDNMSILGLTIDYGPYGWLEDYDPNWTPNTTDAVGRRYRFGNQPQIAHWNLGQLANALVPLIQEVEPLQEILDGYGPRYLNGWRTMMAQKLGLSRIDPASDESLIAELLSLLPMVETDMTIFFRRLARIPADARILEEKGCKTFMAPLLPAYYQSEQLNSDYLARLEKWLYRYLKRLEKENTSDPERRRRMDAVNPKYVLRNYLSQLAIDKAEQDDFLLIEELLDLLRNPYDEQPEREKFAAKRPEWARHRPGCSMLSCSS